MESINSKKHEKIMEMETRKTANSTIESKHTKDTNGTSMKLRIRRPSYQLYGSIYPNPRTKENWKQKYKQLQKETALLREENARQKEEIQSHRFEKHRLIEKYQDIVERLAHLRSENVQVGDYNSQVVHNHYDISLVKDLIGKLEDNLKENTKKGKLIEDLILVITSQFENETELHQTDLKEKTSDSKDRSNYSEMQQLSEHLIDTEMACPVARISQQITDLHRSFTELCSVRKRVQSTVSLDDRNLTNNENKCECRRKIHSEHNLNVEV